MYLKLNRWAIIFLLLLFGMSACQSETADEPEAEASAAEQVVMATDEPEVAETAVPTDTPEPEPTETAVPTDTPEPEPTETAVPTNTAESESADEPEPTETPVKVKPTDVPTKEPTKEPVEPSDSSSEESDTGATDTESVDTISPDPFLLLQNAEDAAARLDSMQMTQVVSVLSSEFTQEITQTCLVELPDDAYCTVDFLFSVPGADPTEVVIETVTLGEESWVREEGGEWQLLPPDAMASAGISEEGMAQLRLSEFVLDAELVGETMVDDTAVYEVAFTIEVNDYVAFILNEEMADLFTQSASENSGEGTLWVGQEDSLSRKASVEMLFVIEGEELTISTQAAYSNYNEPVDIPDPTAGD